MLKRLMIAGAVSLGLFSATADAKPRALRFEKRVMEEKDDGKPIPVEVVVYRDTDADFFDQNRTMEMVRDFYRQERNGNLDVRITYSTQEFDLYEMMHARDRFQVAFLPDEKYMRLAAYGDQTEGSFRAVVAANPDEGAEDLNHNYESGYAYPHLRTTIIRTRKICPDNYYGSAYPETFAGRLTAHELGHLFGLWHSDFEWINAFRTHVLEKPATSRTSTHLELPEYVDGYAVKNIMGMLDVDVAPPAIPLGSAMTPFQAQVIRSYLGQRVVYRKMEKYDLQCI